MIMNTNTNRTLEHLNIFSIDYYKKQQQQQQHQYNEIKMNMSDQHDQTLQTNIKDEKQDYYDDNHLRTSLISTDKIDQPLLIVLDEDDINGDDENEKSNLIINDTTSKDDASNNDEQNINKSPIVDQSLNISKTSLIPVSNTINDSKNSRRPRKSRLFPSLADRNHQTSNKFIRTVVIDTNFMRQAHQQNRHKLIARRKAAKKLSSLSNMSTNPNHSIDDNSNVLSSTDSILSNISFDNISDILTVSRMGSIFYCLEDLYTKVFSLLCTLDEFTNLLIKPGIILIKQVTLSEKISIEQQIPSLKKYNENRYRLISINSSDYLLKLKQLLLTIENLNENEKQQHETRIDQIIDEMRSYKRTPTPVLLKDKILHSPMTTKRLSSDDDDDDDDDDDLEHNEEPRKRLKIVTKKQKTNETHALAPTQFGIFIQCSGPVSCNIFSTNETVSSSTTTTNTETTTTVAKSESTTIKKSTEHENTQIYFDKFQQQCQNLPRFNLNTEQPQSNLNRSDSHSPTDNSQLNKSCSSTQMNMPIKRRILNSYNSDTSDSSSTTTVHLTTSSTNHLRCLYRSKSLTYINNNQENKIHSRRSSSLPSLTYYHIKENIPNKKILSRDYNTKLNVKSKTEPIDLTDENYSMPMIVNVEENVELANQRQKIKNNKSNLTIKQKPSEYIPISDPQSRISSSSSTTFTPRPTSHESNPPMLRKPTPIHHPIPSNSYTTSPYVNYHPESYTYRESSHTIPSSSSSMAHPYPPSTTNPNNGNLYPYPYPYSSSAQYSPIKRSKGSPPSNCYDTRPNSIVAPTHSSSSLNHNTNNSNNNNNNNNNMFSSVVMPIVRKPNYYHQLTPEQQASIKMQTSPPALNSCRLPCCYPLSTIPQQHSHHATDKSIPNERFIYRQYAVAPPLQQTFKRDPSQTPDISNSSPSMNRKQRRIDPIPPSPSTTPYPSYSSTKPYFIHPPPPPSSSSSSVSHWPSASPSTSNPNIKPLIRYPYPPSSTTSMNGMPRKIESYPQPRRPTPVQSRVPPPPPTSTSVVAQNSSTLISPPNTPHELTLPNIRTRSIDLQRAIVERGYCDMDKLPKLVVRHTKTYANKTIDTMGQLFPTWFNEPDYRCIHCFRCDQVFTPQQFMTHVDDEHMQTEQPINMTSIQLLTSEKMSEYKVGLWNQFCTNLTIYAREGRIGGFSTNRNI